jgi:purine nucleosidase
VGAGEPSEAAVRVHGGNGVGGVDLPIGAAADPRTAENLLIDLARRHSGELHVLATGPCTNLARALRAEPRLTSMVASVTVMGGAVRVPGNITPRAEANIHNDPAAAAEVFAASWPVTLVPLDVTMHHRWAEPDRQALRAGGTPVLGALADMLPVYFDFYEPLLGAREVPLHDPLAAGIAVGALTPAEAPVLNLAVDLADGTVREGGSSPVRVVRSLSGPAAPVILRCILDGFSSATLP